jgi:hypothetical protein
MSVIATNSIYECSTGLPKSTLGSAWMCSLHSNLNSGMGTRAYHPTHRFFPSPQDEVHMVKLLIKAGTHVPLPPAVMQTTAMKVIWSVLLHPELLPKDDTPTCSIKCQAQTPVQ